MTSDHFRERIRRREPLIGTFVKTPAFHIIELLGIAGLDFVVADAEHAPIDNGQVDSMVAVAGVLPVLVRVPGNDPMPIASVLDLGATGVVVPHVRSADDAVAVLDAADFARGSRGFSPSVRAGRFGTDNVEAFRSRADKERVLFVQIEDGEALEQLDAIASIDDIDVLFIGPADLALSLGCSGADDPRLQDAITTIAKAGQRHGRAVGIFVGSVEAIAAYRALGISVFICGSDQSFLLAEARRVKRSAFAG
ncbi:aldolase [Rhizobium leguminosarum]|nr:aldolase [Rhizobium leguminosarum]